ncbi:MAG: hypothetical protein P8Y18_11060 [Candidatus Bathyarchaeota archaeon]
MLISTRAELQYLLHRAWEIEKKFESLLAWKSFISTDSNYRSIILTLARESYQHRLNLEKLLKKLGLEAPTNEIPKPDFDLNGLLHSEILQKIVNYDEMAKELYTQILENTDPHVISILIDGSDAFFNRQLRQMIEDETRHIGLVKKMTGKIERIQ